jgi:phenylacetic acid degradation operon negative regulatory protein
MILPITDKFLLSVYDYAEKLDETFDLFAHKTMKEVCCPSLYELKKQYKRQKAKQNFNQLIYCLKKRGYIKIKNLEQNKGVILTKKGTEKVLRAKLKIDKKKRYDKKWQMIIFDIPEEKRHLRDLLRENLRLLKYKMLQQSIWICPYDVQKETEFILRKYSLDPYVKLFLIEEIEI